MTIITAILTILSGIFGVALAWFLNRGKSVPDEGHYHNDNTRSQHEDKIHDIQQKIETPSDLSSDELADWINEHHGSGKR